MEDLLEKAELMRGWEGAELEDGGLEESVASPLGRTPSANHTLLWSRDPDPKQQRPP